MAKVSSSNLPAYTTVENLLKLINVLTKNNKNEESIKALFGLADSAYTCTKSVLRTYGIIENDSLEFTTFGREIAFSVEDDKKDEMIKILRNYEPYELILNSIITSRNEIRSTDINTIKNLWGKADFGSGDRNRNDAATLFMDVIDYTGLGKYVIGRGNNPTRIEWIDGIKEKLNEFSKITLVNEQNNNTISQDIKNVEVDMIPTISVLHETDEKELSLFNNDERNIGLFKTHSNTNNNPNITINVDMSDWPDEKIRIFFKYAYGMFEED